MIRGLLKKLLTKSGLAREIKQAEFTPHPHDDHRPVAEQFRDYRERLREGKK